MDLEAKDAIAIAIALASLVTTTVIALIAYRASKRFATLEADRAVRDLWNQFNTLALSDEKNLVAADGLMSHESKPGSTLEETRRRWLGYVLLNALATSHLHLLRGHTMSKKFQEELLDQQLRALMRSEDLYRMTQHGYEREFKALCAKIRAEVASAPKGGGDSRGVTPTKSARE